MAAFMLLLIVVVVGSAGMAAILGWILHRIARLEKHGPGGLGQLVGENEELREQMRLLEAEVERLSEQVDFTEKLLERPRPGEARDAVGDPAGGGGVPDRAQGDPGG